MDSGIPTVPRDTYHIPIASGPLWHKLPPYQRRSDEYHKPPTGPAACVTIASAPRHHPCYCSSAVSAMSSSTSGTTTPSILHYRQNLHHADVISEKRQRPEKVQILLKKPWKWWFVVYFYSSYCGACACDLRPIQHQCSNPPPRRIHSTNLAPSAQSATAFRTRHPYNRHLPGIHS